MRFPAPVNGITPTFAPNRFFFELYAVDEKLRNRIDSTQNCSTLEPSNERPTRHFIFIFFNIIVTYPVIITLQQFEPINAFSSLHDALVKQWS